MRRLTAFSLAVLLAISPGVHAQEEEPAPEHAKGVRITFIPPPIDGSISLGLFDSAGKLVRVLKREADETGFTVGLNGLITHWDGNDDAGAAAPAGKYQARGYSVGDVGVEGIAFHGNEWISTEESPRLSRVIELALDEKGNLLLKTAQPASLELAGFRYDASKDQLLPMKPDADFPKGPLQVRAPDDDLQQIAASGGSARWLLQAGKLWQVDAGKAVAISFPELGRVISASGGVGSTLWVIDETPEAGRAVKQFSATGELLRGLPVEPDEPEPAQIVADTTKDAIHLLEISSDTTRVRSLVLEKLEPSTNPDGPTKAVSTWQTVLSKSIRSSGDFSEAVVTAMRGKPFAAEPTLNVRLVPNPLFRNQPAKADLQIVATPVGSLLQTADGLPLKQLTETPGLRWAAMAREPGTKAVLMLQSDGAVVEEFRVRRLGQMMGFDAGEYELTR